MIRTRSVNRTVARRPTTTPMTRAGRGTVSCRTGTTTVPVANHLQEAWLISIETPPRSAADRLARKVLLIEDADPKALMSLKGSLLLSAIRCVITYAILPAAAPIFGWSDVVGAPIGIVVSLAAIALSLHSLRRVWLANWTYRWTYTAFISVVVIALTWLLVIDVRALLA